jgi:hypothetical protein
MVEEKYMRLRCCGFALPVIAKKHGGARPNTGGARPGAGRPPRFGPKKPKRCALCGGGFYATKSHQRHCELCLVGRYRKLCDHEKPKFASGNERKFCFKCHPKPPPKKSADYKYKAAAERLCAFCGAVFMAVTHRVRFCQMQCRINYGNKAQAERIQACPKIKANRSALRHERTCGWCGVIFKPTAQQSGLNTKFCTIDCQKRSGDKARRDRAKACPILGAARAARQCVSRAFNRAGVSKTKKTEQVLACSLSFFKNHIERQFVPAMTWANRSEWHIDHIVPLSSAKSVDDVYRLNHYSNLRPLWARDNMVKGAKFLTFI